MPHRLTRRTLLASTAAAAAMLAGPGRAVVPARRPNIVFIMADDLGYADVSCYGRREYRTPEIDRIAAEGLRFTSGYANSAVCSATRIGLITGRYQNRLAAGLEEPIGPRDVGLPPEHPTLPSLLRKAGYGTALVGKWHMGALPRFGPLQSGYDHFWGFRGGGVDYFTHAFLGGKPDLWDDDRAADEPGYLTDLIGDHAITAIEGYARTRQPFLLSVHFNAPHWPWEGPGDEAEAKRLAAKGGFGVYHTDGGSQATYQAMVLRMDQQIGRLLETLDRLKLADDTIVVFTSDNGGERYSDVWPFSGRKTELLEGGLRVPAIIRWPGRVPAGAVSDQVMISMDWMPTFLAAAGTRADPAYPLDGMDLTPMLTGGTAPVPRTLFWRYLNLDQEACRQGQWKYLKILDNSFLFDVVADPLERANLKDRHPDIYAGLVARYRAWDKTMLPLDPAASTGGFNGHDVADHFGVTPKGWSARK